MPQDIFPCAWHVERITAQSYEQELDTIQPRARRRLLRAASFLAGRTYVALGRQDLKLRRVGKLMLPRSTSIVCNSPWSGRKINIMTRSRVVSQVGRLCRRTLLRIWL